MECDENSNEMTIASFKILMNIIFYLDLDLFIEDGKIQSKVYQKTGPIYLPISSCHDRSVFKGVFKSVGLRLRLCARKMRIL